MGGRRISVGRLLREEAYGVLELPELPILGMPGLLNPPDE